MYGIINININCYTLKFKTISLADPGFAPEICVRDFADVAKWSRVSEVSQ